MKRTHTISTITVELTIKVKNKFTSSNAEKTKWFFCARARCLSAGLRYLRLTRLPRHDRGPLPGGNRSAASCPSTVLRRASGIIPLRDEIACRKDQMDSSHHRCQIFTSGLHIGCCLNPLEVSFLLFRCVWWLDCLLLKEGESAFCNP